MPDQPPPDHSAAGALIAQTGRLTLRHPVMRDAQFIYELLNDASWLQNIGDRGVRNTRDAEQYIRDKIIGSYRSFGFGMYVVELTASHESMGLCGLVKRDSLPDPDIGFAFLPAFWNHSYALEASRAVLGHARASLGLTRLLAVVKPDNVRSVRLLERLGFADSGEYRIPNRDEVLTLFAADL